MRKDAIGFFWRDEPIVKVKKEVVKRTPPEPTWLAPDYLPGLKEALAFNVPLFTDQELVEAAHRERLIFDTEIYENYFLAAFKSIDSGRVVYVERTDSTELDISKLNWIINNFTIIGFNSWSFDLPILAIALAGRSLLQIKQAVHRIIVVGENPSDVMRDYKVKRPKIDHIDLIEVAPLRASLKVYAGRLHAKRMQDLPFHPDATLSEPQIAITRWYCVNDLNNTHILYDGLLENIKLREVMGAQYNLDLRSKSDAQIAEYVFSQEVEHLNGRRAARPTILPGTAYAYKVPPYLNYQSELLRWALDIVRRAKFVVAPHGSIEMPKEIGELKLEINGSIYRMGIGGLHSSEKKTAHVSNDKYKLFDYDVTSYYPRIILNQGLFPYHLGANFLRVYNRTVERRVGYKAKGDKVWANALKIVVNGSYGKLGSKWSNLYAPDLLIQVTLTGQLALLLLIERLELAGIHVVSANTDGIVIKCPVELIHKMEEIIKWWENETRFEMERTEYAALYSRDVNNYIAIKTNGKTKTKGAYANPWNDDSDRSMWLHKNPTNTICVEAVEALLTKQIPIEQTVTTCDDVRKFVSVRTVKGGAVKDGVYLGKSIRWYYAAGEEGEIVYASSGNKVPRSDGAKPLMDLPEVCPSDIDYDWYVTEANRILGDIAYV